jgi:hypothetical protein
MEDDIRETVEKLHAGPHGVVLVCTGGGSRAIEWLLAVPGASATVLEALVPYSRQALEALIGPLPGRATGPETAQAMAERAYDRARRWRSDPERPVVGLGCTATLATHYPKRGDHRAVVAVRTATDLTLHALTLTKGARDRCGEEELVSRLTLQALARACGVAAPWEIGLRADEAVVVSQAEPASPVARLLRGDFERLLVLPDGQMLPGGQPEGAIFSGAFNPLHEGHRRLAATAAELLRRPVTFEISVENVDKPPLSEAEVARRLRQFEGLAPVVLTRVPTFHRKAQLFPGATFVIGYDTLERLFAPRYYGGEAEMQAALDEIRSQGAHFLVAGRRHGDRFLCLDDFGVAEEWRPLFTGLPEARFRSDLSSTALRARR